MSDLADSNNIRMLIPGLVRSVASILSLDNEIALDKFYNSKTYKLLSDESTKMWHLSPHTIAQILNGELKDGTVYIPEGVS